MKIVIGVQTCNRVNFTKKTIESVIKWNPEAKEMSWVISDDGSIDNTRKYIEGLSFINESIFHPEQTGITKGLERLVDVSVKYGDVLLYLQNDWKQIRRIDFSAVEKFYEMYSNAGHIAMITDKGKGNHHRLSAFGMHMNLYTKKIFIPGLPIMIERETFIPGNWNYADIPGFTNLKFAVNMFGDKLDESVRAKKIDESGCDNYLLDNQPFQNIDFDSRNQTPGRKF